MTPFIQLVRIALGTLSADKFIACGEEEWSACYEMAKRQAVLGILYQGMMALPEGLKPCARVKVKIAVMAEKIQQMNKKLDSCSASLYNELKALGLKSCLLKGQGTALYYSDPSLRQCGDIDMWVGGDRKSTIEKLSAKWKTDKVFYHHVDVDVFGKSPEVEIHFTPSWMNNPIVNRRLQRWFEAQESLQLDRSAFSPQGSAAGFPFPDIPFNLVFNMAHIYRHLLFEGVGIRQLIDYYYLLKNSTPQEREEALVLIRKFRMFRFAGALSYVMKELFDMDDSYAIAAPSRKYGEQFLKEIFRGGNFGKYDSRNRDIAKSSAPVRFYRRMKRLACFAMAYPSEVLWAPVFKTVQYLFISKK